MRGLRPSSTNARSVITVRHADTQTVDIAAAVLRDRRSDENDIVITAYYDPHCLTAKTKNKKQKIKKTLALSSQPSAVRGAINILLLLLAVSFLVARVSASPKRFIGTDVTP